MQRVIGPCREMIELETFPTSSEPNSPYLLILPAVGDKDRFVSRLPIIPSEHCYSNR